MPTQSMSANVQARPRFPVAPFSSFSLHAAGEDKKYYSNLSLVLSPAFARSFLPSNQYCMGKLWESESVEGSWFYAIGP